MIVFLIDVFLTPVRRLKLRVVTENYYNLMHNQSSNVLVKMDTIEMWQH